MGSVTALGREGKTATTARNNDKQQQQTAASNNKLQSTQFE